MRTHHTFIALSLIVALSACTARQEHRPDAKAAQPPAPARGKTVSELDKSIFYVFQDKNNNHWFGSDGQGVYRFDGKVMTHFTTNDGLCYNRIRGIQGDKSGNLYFTTSAWDGGRRYGHRISKFDGKTFSTLTPTESAATESAWKLQPDDLWFAGGQNSGEVYRYDGHTLHCLKFPKTKAGEEFIARYQLSQYPNMIYSPYDVYIIFKDSRGRLWFGTNIGVCRYDGNSFTWISEEELGFDDTGSALHVRSIIEDKDGKFWFSSTFHRWDVHRNDSVGQGMNFRKEPGIGQPTDQNADPFAYFMSGVKTDNGDLWMATYGGGVWRYDGKSMTHYPVKNGDANLTLFSIYKDKQGDLWLGTHAAGVLKFNGKTFEKFRF